MALTLDIPVRTTMTLPDNWQDCQTPQQLSYWLIAKFNELATTNDITELRELVNEVLEKSELLENEVNNNYVLLDEKINSVRGNIEDSIDQIESTLTGVSDSVKALEDVKYIYVEDNTTFNIPNWGIRRFLVKCNNDPEFVRFTYTDTDELQAGDYIEIVTVAGPNLNTTVALYLGAGVISLDSVRQNGINVYRVYWDGNMWSRSLTQPDVLF